MLNQYGWNLLEKPIIFSIEANTTQLSLADLPPKARKVKLYVFIDSGTCTNIKVTWTLQTKVDIIKIYAGPYNANAVSFSHDNCTLRLDERKIIEVSRNNSFPGPHFSANIEVLAYK